MPEHSRSRRRPAPINVLLVEDDPDDVRCIEAAFESITRETTLHTVTNGYDAVYFLRQRSTPRSPPLPDLALVGLQVPGKSGYEILETIRDDPNLRRLPVIILTRSTADDDVGRCYDAHANASVPKPATASEFDSLIDAIVHFWFDQAHLPSSLR